MTTNLTACEQVEAPQGKPVPPADLQIGVEANGLGPPPQPTKKVRTSLDGP